VANRRIRQLSTARTTSLLLILLALLLALLVGAAPASAFKEWRHNTATEQKACDSSGCHDEGDRADRAVSNAACVGCHSSDTTSGSQMCWDCHAPGTAPSVSCSGDCHLYQASGEHPAYPIAFSHGLTPHLGASGYGKTCADCHGAGNAHHDATGASAPACATCHDGTYAAAPVGHEGRDAVCTSCHEGMNRPSSDCASCHVGHPTSGGPQITYSSPLACGDAGCHGKIKNHVGTSIDAAACTTCHTAHYESLGTCTKCHADPQSFHHGTAKATPLADCATCHNGTLAKLPSAAHTAFGTACASCHTGMNRPSGDCAMCHVGNPGSGSPQLVYSNSLTCDAAGCHGKIKNHVGTSISAAACTTCHAEHYKSLGTCTKCHADPQSFHHGTAKATPLADCATCHNGTIAAAPKAHTAYGTNCASCHTGMNRPSADCATCHATARGRYPAIVSTNPLTCADALCHAKVASHSGTAAITAAPCTTCHTSHYESLGQCTKCHTDPKSFHHGTAKAIPLVDCTKCHNGTLASDVGNHGTLTSCTPCHDPGMKLPSVPAACVKCHDVAATTTTSCLASGCHTQKQIHAPGPAGGVDCTSCHAAHYKEIAPCTTCHPDRAGYHHKAVKAIPLAACGSCHDGKIASLKKAHASLTCATCHTGMALPAVPAICQDCHDAERFGATACIKCHSATGSIGRETVHVTDPAATVTCTTCHKAHYEDLGACDACHGSHAETHHGTATLADTELKLAVTPAKVKPHKKATLKGTLQAGGIALASQSVLIQARKLKGGPFKKVALVTTGADGGFSRVVKPRVGTEYRAVWLPTGAYVVQQRPAIVTVKLRVRK